MAGEYGELFCNLQVLSVDLATPCNLINRFTCHSFKLIYVVICDTCKEEYIGETREGKTKVRDRVRVHRQHIQQPQYQQLKVKEHLRVCGKREFWVFSLLQIRS